MPLSKLAPAAALFLLPVLVALRASAEDAPTKPSKPSTAAPATASSWYGGEILIPDLASFALLGIGLGTNDGTAGSLRLTWGLGSLVFLAGGPIVHGIHHQGGKVGMSIGLRLLAPIAGAGAASAAGQSSCDSDCVVPALLGFAGGMVVASAVDVALLAREPEPKPSGSLVRLAPDVRLGRSGAQVGLTGEF